MSEQNVSEQNATTAEGPGPGTQGSPTPTVTYYQQLALKLDKLLADFTAEIPGYNDELSADPRKLHRLAKMPFVADMASVVEGNPALNAVEPNYVAQTRDTQQYSEVFRHMMGSLQGVVTRMDLIMRLREVNAGRGANRFYAIARRVSADNPNDTQLAAHMQRLKVTYKRPKTPAKKPPETPAAGKGGASAA